MNDQQTSEPAKRPCRELSDESGAAAILAPTIGKVRPEVYREMLQQVIALQTEKSRITGLLLAALDRADTAEAKVAELTTCESCQKPVAIHACHNHAIEG